MAIGSLKNIGQIPECRTYGCVDMCPLPHDYVLILENDKNDLIHIFIYFHDLSILSAKIIQFFLYILQTNSILNLTLKLLNRV